VCVRVCVCVDPPLYFGAEAAIVNESSLAMHEKQRLRERGIKRCQQSCLIWADSRIHYSLILVKI